MWRLFACCQRNLDLIKVVVDYANGHPIEVGISGGGIALILVILALISKKNKIIIGYRIIVRGISCRKDGVNCKADCII